MKIRVCATPLTQAAAPLESRAAHRRRAPSKVRTRYPQEAGPASLEKQKRDRKKSGNSWSLSSVRSKGQPGGNPAHRQEKRSIALQSEKKAPRWQRRIRA